MSRIFLIHGWTGENNRDWFPWAKEEFQKRGYEVIAPEMPDTNYPKIKPWVEKLKEVVVIPRPEDVFIGHSIGCQAIERYFQTLAEDTRVNKVILIAPWVVLTEAALDDPEQDGKIVKPWYETPIDYKKIKPMAGEWVAVFSEDDPWVSYKDNFEVYKEKLGARIILEKAKGHFTEEEGVRKIPSLLELAR